MNGGESMKRFASVLLAVVFMLSLSVFSFADSVPPIEQTPFYVGEFVWDNSIVIPYSLYPGLSGIYYSTSPINSNYSLSDPVLASINSNGYYFGNDQYSTSASTPSLIYFSSGTTSVNFPRYQWGNIIMRVKDSNGNIINPITDLYLLNLLIGTSSDFTTGTGSMGSVIAPSSSNVHIFEDGFFQIALCASSSSSFNSRNVGFRLVFPTGTPSAVYSFELEKFDFYSGESSQTVPPFTFGDGAHTVLPPTPEDKDPNDHTQYGSASDQVEWYNDAYGAAVDPELEDKMSATTDMLLQEQEIEEQMIDGINQYAPSVDPTNLTMPTQIVNGIRFIGTTFMGSYNALGDIGFVISFSMMLGVVLVLIGRGEGALSRGISSSARERRRTEYASDRDMKKGG